MTDQEYTFLKQKIRRLTGLDLDAYKSTQMRRRLNSFVGQSRAATVLEFCRKLETNPGLLEDLRNYMTINVSEFFRDEDSFNYLKNNILPSLVRSRNRISIWSAGCSCGQEPYSIAILLDMLGGSSLMRRILATDIDAAALRVAAAGGPYGHESLRNVCPSILARYFAPAAGGYKVNAALNRRVEFKSQNLLEDTFDDGFDLIICRNVTIYFTNEAKYQLNRKFHGALKDGGVLFIGGTETSLDMQTLGFRPLAPSFFVKEGPMSLKTTSHRVLTAARD
jgi:chemotaxis protein methyltransferase CheR